MNKQRTALLVIGTRPEAIKLAPVAFAMRRLGCLRPVLAVTGQHGRDMLGLEQTFGLTANHILELLKPGQGLGSLTGSAISLVSSVVASIEPDLVVVQGDTASTLAGAFGGFIHGSGVVHLEAGLRTHHPRIPFPEEMNRRLTSQLTSLHLCPTRTSAQNLLREGFDERSIVITGNTVVDALQWAVAQPLTDADPQIHALVTSEQPMVLVTAHRRESWGGGMAALGRALANLADTYADWLFVFPMHPNPTVRRPIRAALGGHANVLLLEPLQYIPFCHVMQHSRIILTDSGGIQEEAPSLGRPVLVMRDNTERPEAVTAGTVRLVGMRETAIVDAVSVLIEQPDVYAGMANAVNPYGDGRAAERAVRAIEWRFAAGVRPVDFSPADAEL